MHYSKSYLRFFFIFCLAFWTVHVTPNLVSAAPAISNIRPQSTSVREYEKYEVRFDVSTVASNLFFQYDENPPPGVTPRTGISVSATITTPSGKTLNHPAFFMTEVERGGSGSGVYFMETNRKYWVLRYSPQELGTHTVSLTARDSSGITTQPVGSFTATAPVRPGFIQVSSSDSRYFEFSNGSLYFPIGPAYGDDYAKWKDTGQNLERPWMAGFGAYSTNWARWISSSENQGNEGIRTVLSYTEHAPGSELSYHIFYPEGFRIWFTSWENSRFYGRLKPNTRYQLRLVYKATGLSGPRVSGQPWGIVAKNHGFLAHQTPPADADNQLRNSFRLFSHITANSDWTTLNTQFTTGSSINTDISLFLDNVTAGQIYVDEFSIREVLADSSYGGELIRNPKADVHTYVDPRGAAYFDWQLEQGEQNGVYFKYVVHDKNDWITDHLTSAGQFAATGNGYYQEENTKSRWLLRQWYRYLIARYDYSTAVHSWELNNEGPPNEDPPGSGTAPHWRTAQAFAKFMHENSANRHLATTSFWCCWRNGFWGNHRSFPDIDYADLHEYSFHKLTYPTFSAYDMANFIYNLSMNTSKDNPGKPIMLAETGLTTENGDVIDELRQSNPGIYYHNMLWAQLNSGSLTSPNYWWIPQHLQYINQAGISKPFWDFVKTLGVNRGGYTPLSPTVSNSQLRVWGQRNLNTNRAYAWVQNADHTWKRVKDNQTTSQSGSISLTLKANSNLTVEWWNTYTGAKTTQNITSDGNGKVTLQISGLTDDRAFKIYPQGQPDDSGPQPTSPPTIRGDSDNDGDVDGLDFTRWLNHYDTRHTNGPSWGDFDSNGVSDGLDFTYWINNYTG